MPYNSVLLEHWKDMKGKVAKQTVHLEEDIKCHAKKFGPYSLAVGDQQKDFQAVNTDIISLAFHKWNFGSYMRQELAGESGDRETFKLHFRRPRERSP
jgi:hypothetical protein